MISLAQILTLLSAIILISFSLQHFQTPIREYSTKKFVQLSNNNVSKVIVPDESLIWQTYLDGSRAKVPAPTRAPALAKEAWIDRFIQAGNETIDFSLISTALCDQVTWDPSLVFECENISDEEYSDARGQLLNCLRFAIELGAGIILPWVGHAPDAEALRRGTGRLRPFFDELTFRKNIAQACPQLVIYESLLDLKLLGKVYMLPELSLSDVHKGSGSMSILNDSPQWIEGLERWIEDSTRKVEEEETRLKDEDDEEVEMAKENIQAIRVLKFPARITYWRVCDDVDAVVYTFGLLLNPRRDIERLSASILYEMIKRYKLEVNVDDPFVLDGYLGVQLYAYDDTDYWKKKEAFIKLVDDKRMSIIYAATNDRGILDRFFIDGYPRDILWKSDLMTRSERLFLSSLPHGIQTLVDHLVLKSATYFEGVDRSSESWMISASRRVAMKQQICKLHIVNRDEVAYSDDWSRIYKNEDDHKGFVEGIWPS